MKVHVVLTTNRFVEIDSVYVTKKDAQARVDELNKSDCPPYDISIHTFELHRKMG